MRRGTTGSCDPAAPPAPRSAPEVSATCGRAIRELDLAAARDAAPGLRLRKREGRWWLAERGPACSDGGDHRSNAGDRGRPRSAGHGGHRTAPSAGHSRCAPGGHGGRRPPAADGRHPTRSRGWFRGSSEPRGKGASRQEIPRDSTEARLAPGLGLECRGSDLWKRHSDRAQHLCADPWVWRASGCPHAEPEIVRSGYGCEREGRSPVPVRIGR